LVGIGSESEADYYDYDDDLGPKVLPVAMGYVAVCVCALEGLADGYIWKVSKE
jgi:hypothetical protein